MRAAIVINPTKVDDVAQARATIAKAFSDRGLAEPSWHETTTDDPGFGQTRQAIEEGCAVVFACGGDGTVRACAHELAGTGVALAILPMGTGNLLVSNLALPTDVDDVVAVAASGQHRRIDLGQLDDSHFTVMAGMGLDAAMMQATPEPWKRRIGWPAYLIGGVRSLRDRPFQVTVSIDGQRPFRRTIRTVLVANVGQLQGGLHLFADARPDDGLLDIAIIGPRTLADWVVLATTVLMRRRPNRRHMETFQGSTVDIRASAAVPREMDGDPIEPGRAITVLVRPGALLLCAPDTRK